LKNSAHRPLLVCHDRVQTGPVLDTATSHALLRRVARQELNETLRLYVPDEAVMFSMLDAHRSGFKKARTRADERGFPGVFRLAGGHAALFHSRCLAFAWAMPAAESDQGIRSRFELVSQWIQRGLTRAGVPAQVGEVPGEYCPGEYSVNALGKKKLMGVGQRVIRGAAHVGGVIVVREAERIKDVLTDVYADLELDWDPDTAGAVEDTAPGITPEDVLQALLEELKEFRDLEPTGLDEQTRALGQELITWHSPLENPKGRTALLDDKVVAALASTRS
jgi:lipoate-protein ligase A